MVKGIRVKRGHVTVTVALTVPGCPMRTEITQRVTRSGSSTPMCTASRCPRCSASTGTRS
jgi:metal-sulfur cluster biosynthetic enzyme